MYQWNEEEHILTFLVFIKKSLLHLRYHIGLGYYGFGASKAFFAFF